MKKKVQKSTTESKVDLVDAIYCYGGEQAIESMGEYPLDVPRAYEELRNLRQGKGEDYPDAFHCKFNKKMQLTIDKETSKVINKKCFEFVQQLMMKNPSVLESTTTFGGMYSKIEWSRHAVLHISKR